MTCSLVVYSCCAAFHGGICCASSFFVPTLSILSVRTSPTPPPPPDLSAPTEEWTYLRRVLALQWRSRALADGLHLEAGESEPKFGVRASCACFLTASHRGLFPFWHIANILSPFFLSSSLHHCPYLNHAYFLVFSSPLAGRKQEGPFFLLLRIIPYVPI